jgi:aspartyl protease family protein
LNIATAKAFLSSLAPSSRRRCLGALLTLATLGASAQTVTLSGSMGDKALLVINGRPHAVAAGATYQNVKVVSVGPGEAVVEQDGKRLSLQIGGAPVDLGRASGGGSGEGREIVLSAGPGGHFFTSGSINGRTVQFVVDTGATYVALGQADADRIGLKYKEGRRGTINTANGAVAAYLTSLDSVRVGDVQVYNVDAVVVPASMGTILLGNSFLSRFSMKRESDRMTLERQR